MTYRSLPGASGLRLLGCLRRRRRHGSRREVQRRRRGRLRVWAVAVVPDVVLVEPAGAALGECLGCRLRRGDGWRGRRLALHLHMARQPHMAVSQTCLAVASIGRNQGTGQTISVVVCVYKGVRHT